MKPLKNEPVWESMLRDFAGNKLTNPAVVKHGLSWVPISSIAAQTYCEQKVELKYVHGEVPTETKTKGEAMHEELIKMEKTPLRKLVTDIKTRKLSIVSFPLVGVVAEVGIIGVPDAVIFRKGIPKWVFELKTTKGDLNFLWEDQALQVRLYGLLLDLMGFDCSNLKLAVVRLRHENFEPDARYHFLTEVGLCLASNTPLSLESEHAGHLKVHQLLHARDEVMPVLKEKLRYWLSSRPLVSSTSAGKCRACEFNSTCPLTLWNPSTNKTVIRPGEPTGLTLDSYKGF